MKKTSNHESCEEIKCSPPHDCYHSANIYLSPGHGKLMLGDGGYYEGSFVHGEIEGHGFRVFGSAGCSYTGAPLY